MRRILVAILMVVAALGPAPAAEMVVDELRGAVVDATYARFERFVGDHLGKVIGLKVRVDPSAKSLSVSAEGGQLVVYRTTQTKAEIVSSSGFTRQQGSYVLDGFFRVKSGGMHQGIVSYGLEPVSEAALRQGSTVRTRPSTLGR